jgi:hypothetical protein
MSDIDATDATDPDVEQPTTEVVSTDEVQAEQVPGESVTQPAKVMRIGSMVKQLLEEVRNSELDEASRERLAELYERSVIEVSEALSPDLQEELRSLALPFEHDEVPSEAELRVAKAQLVGWLEGLFHGIQASMAAQQAMAQVQAAQQQQRAIAGGATGNPAAPGQPATQQADRPGTYL